MIICTHLKLTHHFHRTSFLPHSSLGARPLGLRLPQPAQHLRCIPILRNSLVGRPLAPTVVLHRRSLADTPARLQRHTQLRLLVPLRIHLLHQGRLLQRLTIPLRNLPGIRLRLLLLLGALHLQAIPLLKE